MYFQFFLKMLTVEIYTLLSCSYALLDVARSVAASSHLIGVCTTCALHSVPCWSAMSAHTCGSEYYCFLNGTHLPKTSWRKDLLTELKRQLSTICKSLHWTRHWNRYREEVYCGWPQLLPGNCLNNRNISFFFFSISYLCWRVEKHLFALHVFTYITKKSLDACREAHLQLHSFGCFNAQRTHCFKSFILMQTPTNRILCFLTTTMLVTFINNTPDKTQKTGTQNHTWNNNAMVSVSITILPLVWHKGIS